MRRKYKAHILLVEDETLLRSLYYTVLAKAGYSVAKARDGLEALELLRSSKYDLVLLDIVLPNMDGIEVLKSVYKEKDTIPTECENFVILTNLVRDNIITLANRFQIRGTLVKSDYNPGELLGKIDELLTPLS